jgi:hypothetical protein
MGWGLLFFGYFLEFILGMNAMFAPFVYFPAYAFIVVGCNGLARYCKRFVFPKWCAFALMLPAIWRTFVGINAQFSLGLGFLPEVVTEIVEWLHFGGVVVLHILLALAVKELALRVGQTKNAVRAVRNLVMVGIHALLMLLQMTIPLESVVRVLYPVTVLLQLTWAICNCVMLYSCYMHIAPANENEDRKPSRFGFVNRIRDKLDEREQKAIEADRAYHAENAKRAHDKKVARMSKKQQAREHKRGPGRDQ